MNRWWLAAALLAVVGPVNAADLSLERIMLSSGGVVQGRMVRGGGGALAANPP